MAFPAPTTIARALEDVRHELAARAIRITATCCLGSALAACSRTDARIARPAVDPALDPAAAVSGTIPFDAAKPQFCPRHHVELLTHFEGLDRTAFPEELQHEITEWEMKLPRDRRRDPDGCLPNGVPKDWSPARAWYAGPIQGSVQLRCLALDGGTFGIGAALHLEEWKDGEIPAEPARQKRSSLGWTSATAPSRVTWIERDFLLPEFAQQLAYDVARHDRGLVVLCAVSGGLREFAFEARDGELVETHRRSVGPPNAFDPLLLETGGDLLLFWSEFTRESSRRGRGGCALRVARLAAGSSEWSAPATLTIDLENARGACATGDQVTVAWSDDRFERMEGLGFRNGGKLCVARSTDRGASWSVPVLLHDPEDERAEVGGRILVLDDGARILVVNADGEPWDSGAGLAADAFAVSRDLQSWFPVREKLYEQLVALRMEETARLPR